jgi:hypothetical protein
MRGHIKLFTLPLDLDRAYQFGTMDTEASLSTNNSHNTDIHLLRREIYTPAE